MHTLLRHLKRTLVGFSFVLCLATLLLVGRSCWRMDTFDRYRPDVAGRDTFHDTRGIFSSRGSIGAGYLRLDAAPRLDWPADQGWRRQSLSALTVTWPHRWSLLGFGYWNHQMPAVPQRGRMHVVGVKVPHWFIAVLLAVAPTRAANRAWIHRRTRKRLTAGLCVACGYDVRANNERCPECGAAVPSPSGRRPG